MPSFFNLLLVSGKELFQKFRTVTRKQLRLSALNNHLYLTTAIMITLSLKINVLHKTVLFDFLFIKIFFAPQRSVKIKISVNFRFDITFRNARDGKGMVRACPPLFQINTPFLRSPPPSRNPRCSHISQVSRENKSTE